MVSQIKAKQSPMKCRVFISLIRCTRWLWFLSWWIKFHCTIILMKPVFVTKTIWQHLDLHSQGQTYSFQWDCLLLIPISTNLANFLPFVSTAHRRNSSGWLNHDKMLLSSSENSSGENKEKNPHRTAMQNENHGLRQITPWRYREDREDTAVLASHLTAQQKCSI